MKKVPSALSGSLVILTLLAPVAAADITKVVNAASFTSNNTFSPGTIISIKGDKLANTTAGAPDPTNPPTTLGGVTVQIGGVASALFYVSPAQINARIDPSVGLGAKTLSLSSPAGTFTTQIQIVQAGSPGIFSLGGTGSGEGAILNAVTFAPGPFSVTTLGQPTYLAIYATGLDLSTMPALMPKVTVGGVSLPVLFAGPAPGFIGLQQINVQLLAQLAGAGRVSMMITTGVGGKTTNVVEIMILPSPGQGPFAPDAENQSRSRELAAIAWVPTTNLALLTDENDDVVRVIDIKAKKVTKTIALPAGAEPVAVAADSAGKTAIVVERGRNKVAILDLTKFTVSDEVPLNFGATAASGPAAIAILSNVALVLNSDTDNVSVLDVNLKKVMGLVEVGRSPRGIGSDSVGNQLMAYVTNQDAGTISVINVISAVNSVSAAQNSLRTLKLGDDVRPQSILVLPAIPTTPPMPPLPRVGVVTEPDRHETGRVLLVNLENGLILADVDVNPDGSGGASEMAYFDGTVYFANQSGGSVTAAKVVPPSGTQTAWALTPRTIKAGTGARALAIDQLDKLLLVTNQGSGEVVLIDLVTNQIAGRINGVRSEMDEDDGKHDDHGDRDRATNAPVISSLRPGTEKAGTSFTMTIIGTNFSGATDVVFLDPESLPGNGRGNGNSGNHGKGPVGRKDPAFTVTNLHVTSPQQLTATVTIRANAGKGERVVQVHTPNGESSSVMSPANTFTLN